MSTMTNLRYVTRNRLEAPVDDKHPDCPFYSLGARSAFGLRVLGSEIRKLRWEVEGKKHELSFDDDIRAVPAPSGELIIVNTSSMGAEAPNNGLVFNFDGTLNHQITVPQYVERTFTPLSQDSPVVMNFPVERITEVRTKDNRVVIGLQFDYEWVERRYYDPTRMLWQERDQISRQ